MTTRGIAAAAAWMGLIGAGDIPPPPLPPGASAMLTWMPGDVRCGGQVVAPLTLRRPAPAMTYGRAPLRTLDYTFAIDADGRPHAIRRDATDPVFNADDVAPSLAATRFAAGSARADCRIGYAARVTTMAETPVEDLAFYQIDQRSGPLPPDGWARIAAGDCRTDPQPLEQHYPDFAKLPRTPGTRDWTLVGYDLDDRGRPRGVATRYGTGNAALDAAGRRAVAASRYTGGARTGCVYRYWLTAGVLPAPPMPDTFPTRLAAGDCADPHGWRQAPALRFPEPYRRRGIEGWAVVAYDVAPWGAIGNLQVLASEPSDDFGRQATLLIGAATLPPGRGMTGCVDKVRFVMGPEDDGRRRGPVPVPPPVF